MWPTAARDFVSLWVTRHLKEKFYGIAVKGLSILEGKNHLLQLSGDTKQNGKDSYTEMY